MRRSFARFSLVLVLVGLIAVFPATLSAGPSEDALEECIDLCHGIGVCIAGCLAGYVIFGNSSDDTDSVARFDHLSSVALPPIGPFGNEVVVFSPGDKVTLRAGRWTGCPPDCQETGRFLPGPGPVATAAFSIVSSQDLRGAETLDSAPWQSLGKGRFNTQTNFWELGWDTSTFAEPQGYMVQVEYLPEGYGEGGERLSRGFTMALRRASTP